MCRVGDEASLGLQRFLISSDEPICRDDQGRRFLRNADGPQRLARVDAAPDDINRKKPKPAHRAIDRPADDQPGERNGEQKGEGGTGRRMKRDLMAGASGLCDLDVLARVAPAIDAPVPAGGGDVGKTWLGLPWDVDLGSGAVNDLAGSIPDPDDKMIFVFAVQQRAGLASIARTDVHRDFLQLGVEELVHFVADKRERRRRGGEAHDREHGCPPDGDGPAERNHDAALVTIQPAPRMLRMISLPYFLRRPWIAKSTALLCTSSLQP